MKRLLATAVLMAAASGQVCAQQATAVGTGIGVAKSSSKSDAVAVGGGVGNTGVVNANPTSTVTVGGSPANSTITTQGKTSVSTVPSVFAPGLAAAGLETCLGSVSVGASWLGTGLTGGGSIPDAGCAARLDARTLWSMGLKKAAVARLCLNPDIYRSMPDICATYLPAPPTGYVQPVLAATVESPYAGSPYAGGDIWLTEGKTGLNKLCKDYDASHQRCRMWAGDVRHHAATKKGLVHGDKLPTTAALTKEDDTK
jgi:hypothetical protein